MNIEHTQTGRFSSGVPSMLELPRGADYMMTTNKAQLMAAIQAVPHDSKRTLVIVAISTAGRVLARFTFPRASERLRHHDAETYERHLRRTVANVRRTPASLWR